VAVAVPSCDAASCRLRSFSSEVCLVVTMTVFSCCCMHRLLPVEAVYWFKWAVNSFSRAGGCRGIRMPGSAVRLPRQPSHCTNAQSRRSKHACQAMKVTFSEHLDRCALDCRGHLPAQLSSTPAHTHNACRALHLGATSTSRQEYHVVRVIFIGRSWRVWPEWSKRGSFVA